MPWVEFTGDYDWHIPGTLMTRAFKAGQIKMITTPCSIAALAAGKAKRTRRPAEKGPQHEASRPGE